MDADAGGMLPNRLGNIAPDSVTAPIARPAIATRPPLLVTRTGFILSLRKLGHSSEMPRFSEHTQTVLYTTRDQPQLQEDFTFSTAVDGPHQ